MKKFVLGLLLTAFTLLTTSLNDSWKEQNIDSEPPEISGTPLPETGFPSGTLAPDLKSGTGAYYAEYLFWDTFHGQKYENTPQLFKQLYKALEENPDEFSRALVYGRLGFTFLWLYSESEYAMSKKGIDVISKNSKYIAIGKKALKTPLLSAKFPHVYPTHFDGIQIATAYFGLATELVMDTKEYSQKQNWTEAIGSDLIPGSELAWRTFPSVVTGFYASFNKFPGFGPAKQNGNGTIPMWATMEAISYSKGFNFATHVFGDVGGNRLAPRDLALMIQMMKLGAEEAVGEAIVPGNTTSYPKNAKIFRDFYPKLGEFYAENSDLNVIQRALYPPTPVTNYWNKPIPWKGFTPAEIVKASTGSSIVVPHNFENNFLMLGDTFVATYYKNGELPSNSQNTDLKNLLLTIYTNAKNSSTWSTWPYQSSIIDRIRFLNNDNIDSLYNAAQNYSIAGVPHGPHQSPANPSHYPSCMTCHQK